MIENFSFLQQAALNMVTKSLNNDLQKEGILAASFHPGWVISDMGGKGAKLTPEQSAHDLLQVFTKVDDTCNGHMFDNTGKIVPW